MGDPRPLLLLISCLLVSSSEFLVGISRGRRHDKGWSRFMFPRGGESTPQEKGEEEPMASVAVPDQWAPGPKRGLVLMDNFCRYHGGYIETMAKDVYGVAVINVLSNYMANYLERSEPGLEEIKTMSLPASDEESKVQEWLDSLPVDRIEAIICESDSGLPHAESFGTALGLRKHNGCNEARRNKYLMNEALKRSNIPVVKQKLCKSVEEALEFSQHLGLPETSETPFVANPEAPLTDEDEGSGLLGWGRNSLLSGSSRCCIVKPVRGVGSESVHLCRDQTMVRQAFENVFGSTVFGSPAETHDAVLVQEFAMGTEFALDTVSKDGHHKVAAVWRYDKRPANGAPFVYHATELVDGNTEDCEAVCAYARQTLDALGVRWGMTHTEIILTEEGPRLVEVNCRQHNMDFAPLAMVCIGYNALDMLLAAYLSEVNTNSEMRLEWDLLPDVPVTRAMGAMVHLVNHKGGQLIAVNEDGLREIAEMASVLDMEIYPSFAVGNQIAPTVDICSDAGWVQIVNDDEEEFLRDYNRIVELMPTLFMVEEQ